MTASASDLIAELDRTLEPGRFPDYCVNGLQLPGADRVGLIATGVSANLRLCELAAERGADMLLVHHGLFWGDGVRAVDPLLAGRLRVLLSANIAMAAYHLPLDAHPEIGNNALIAGALSAEPREPFGEHHGEHLGCIATLAAGGRPIAELLSAVQRITAREPQLLGSGPPLVRRVAVLSGSGGDYIAEAARAGADVLLTGEVSERSPEEAREYGLHLVAAGHHATETFGVSRAGEELAARFGIEHVFLEVPNPV